MKKVLKQTLSVLLAVVMTFTITLPAFAEESGAEQKANTQTDVNYEATNAIGDLILDNYQKSENDSENAEYLIQSVFIEEKIATVELQNLDACTVVVAIYENKGGKMVASGKADIEAKDSVSDDTVTVEIDTGEMPEYFYVKTFLINALNIPLCESYDSMEYTKEFDEFMEKTTDDFETDKLINLDETEDNNFLVVTDDATIIEPEEGENIVAKDDYENGIYVIENADEQVKNLKKGDVFYYQYGEGENEYIIIKIEEITIDGDTVTLTASEVDEISELFQYIKIDETTAQTTFDDSGMAEGVTHESMEISTMRHDVNVDAAVSTIEKWSIDIELPDYIEFGAGIEGTFSVGVKFFYDFYLFDSDYYYFELIFTSCLDVGVYVSGKVDTKIPLGQVGFNFFGAVTANAEFTFVFEAEAELELSFSIAESVVGASYDSVNGLINKTKASEAEFDNELNFEITFFAGFEIKPKVKVFECADMSLSARIGLDAEITHPVVESDFGIHDCGACLDIKIDFVASISMNIKIFKIFNKKTTFGSIKINMLTAYYSNDIGFGEGNCPNMKYAVNINVADDKNKPVTDAIINDKYNTNSYGKATLYLPNGRHFITVKFPSGISKTETIMIESNPIDLHVGIVNLTGKCGDNASWTITEYGELQIYGTGPMYDYDESGPWNAYAEQIYSVVIGDGITYIGENAFSELTYLYDVTLGAKVETIGDYAFDFCYGLTRIKLNNGLKTIGSMAFSDTSIEVLDIPASVTTFGEWPFDMMYCLTAINVNSGNQKYSSKNGVLFNKDQRTLIYYPQGREATTYTIPDSVVNIGDYAFASARYLTSVTFGRNVTTIGNSAFDRSALTSVNISGKIKTVGSYAFSSCSDLKSVYVGDKVSTIDSSTFSYSDKLSSITISSYNPYYTTLNNVIYDKAMTTLIYCPSMHTGTFTVPAGVKVIGEDAFDKLSPLTKIVLSSEVEIIKDGAFSNMDELEEIVIPKSVKTIEQYAFYNCDALKYVRYTGSSSQWSKISIDYWNDDLKHASRTYNYNPVNATAAVMSLSPDDKLSAYSVSNVQSETITDAVVDSDYIMIAVKDASAEDLLAPSNLLYIDQKRAESEELTFEYVIDESITDYDVLVFGQKLPHYHLYDETITTSPTCTEKGVKTFTCECGDSYTEEIEMLDHEYESAVTAPTCTEQGFTTYTCSCGDSYVADYVDVADHTDEVIPGYGATCTETGLTDGVKCSVCGEVTSEQEIIPVIEHDDSDSDGYCDECGEDLTVNCSHSCHSSGFVNFFWKIINFLQKLFGVDSARYCECGVDHWA